jgi:N-acetylmuramoyl-L-alanine amidase
MVLEGADMPAILIEIGYITNPVDEKSLLDMDVLSKIAKAMRNGIDDFFEKFQ